MASHHHDRVIQSRINTSVRSLQSAVTALDAQISSGSDVSLANAQQVGLYARNDASGQWYALNCDQSGHLEVNLTQEGGLGYLDSIDNNIIYCDTNNVVGTMSMSGSIVEANSAAILAKLGDVCVNTQTLTAVDYATQTELAALNAKVTICNTGAVVISSGSVTETNSSNILSKLGDISSIDYATQTELASLNAKVTAVNTGAVVISSGSVTESNSSDILSKLGDISSIDYATQTELAALNAKVTAVNTGAVVVASGSVTETNSSDILSKLGDISASVGSIDGKMSWGADTSLANAQQVAIYGQANGGKYYPIKVNTSGRIRIEEEHTWTTETLINSVSVADSANTTSSTLDLGADAHPPNGGHGLIFFLDMDPAIASYQLGLQISPNGTDWFNPPNESNIFAGSEPTVALQINNDFSGYGIGARYYRFIFANNDGSANSTTVDLTAGYYA